MDGCGVPQHNAMRCDGVACCCVCFNAVYNSLCVGGGGLLSTCRPAGPCYRWVEAAGGRVTCSEGVEVSPLVSVAGEGLEAVVAGQEFASAYNVHLQAGGGGY